MIDVSKAMAKYEQQHLQVCAQMLMRAIAHEGLI